MRAGAAYRTATVRKPVPRSLTLAVLLLFRRQRVSMGFEGSDAICKILAVNVRDLYVRLERSGLALGVNEHAIGQ